MALHLYYSILFYRKRKFWYVIFCFSILDGDCMTGSSIILYFIQNNIISETFFVFCETILIFLFVWVKPVVPVASYSTWNQSMSAHPPSPICMCGRVQKMPYLAPIHAPSRSWNVLPSCLYFFPSML